MIFGVIIAAMIGFTGGVAATVNEPKVEKFGNEYLAGAHPASKDEINNGVVRN